MKQFYRDLLNREYSLLLLVHPSMQVLSIFANELGQIGLKQLNINHDLSTALLPVLSTERTRFASQWFFDTMTTINSNPMLCTNIDILFEPALELDPLALFRQGSFRKKLVVIWPGEYESYNLSYAVPTHHHYRFWQMKPLLDRQPAILVHRLPDH